MENEQREVLARGREVVSEWLKGMDAALLAFEVVARAEALAQENAELPAKIEALKGQRADLDREIAERQKKVEALNAEYQRIERDWIALKQLATGKAAQSEAQKT